MTLQGYLLRGVLKQNRTLEECREWSWARYYYVLVESGGGGSGGGGGILHQYESREQALRKSNSATKKNRLKLEPSTSTSENSYGSYGFEISTLNGRIQWQLSASSSNERKMWIDRIESICH